MKKNRNKLQALLAYERGQPLFYKYLRNNGFTSQLLQKYRKSNWLERVAPEVYKHTDKPLSPLLSIKAMQEQEFKHKLDFVLGGQSALYLQGVRHFLKKAQTYYVFRTDQSRTPHLKWLKSQKIYNVVAMPLFKTRRPLVDSVVNIEGLIVSSPERALLEMAYLVPTKADYDEFVKLMELCPSLRSNLLQTLLEKCVSIKAKRLFLYVASTVNHPWYKKLNETKIDLGTGARQLVVGGKYIGRYAICVPEGSNFG
ncbi:antitoxin AbiEi [Candidatus Termititenax aidoneus]|uniref:Antitoxin AbiEi n=1 Tax=Termititenax aidoneus TaxID=2218524 RepID=A0A388T8K2_TERA1|nr:antitoxin AbiEi [Candidatus Termititenax aidoneus]